MRITDRFIATVTFGLAAVVASAQPTPQRRAQPRTTLAHVVVRDLSGTPLRDVRVTISGPTRQEIVTDADGSASLGTIRDGSFRLRFERDGFITLERDISIPNGQPSTFEVALSAAPPPPSGPLQFFSIPDFLDKNYIGREPIKESVLACLADSTTRLLQLHEAIGEHTHADMDEVLYIVAGEGTIRARGESSAVAAGSLSVIPHGVAHAILRHGKNPLMVLSMLSGAPCPANVPAGRRDR